jgi:hypothetical protein
MALDDELKQWRATRDSARSKVDDDRAFRGEPIGLDAERAKGAWPAMRVEMYAELFRDHAHLVLEALHRLPLRADGLKGHIVPGSGQLSWVVPNTESRSFLRRAPGQPVGLHRLIEVRGEYSTSLVQSLSHDRAWIIRHDGLPVVTQQSLHTRDCFLRGEVRREWLLDMLDRWMAGETYP